MSKRKRFLLRIQPELFDALQRWADDEFRSINGQIEYLLQQAVRKAGRERKRGAEGAEGRSGDETG